MKRIVITTNNLNRNGYRILTAGIIMTAFLKNPVMFYDHNTYRLPIGRWDDIQIDKNGVMTGVPVFDEKDEDALKIKQKYEDGYLNAASLHVRPMEYSETDVVQGQQFETITKCEMLEISIVGIPGNAEAVRLSGVDTPPIIIQPILSKKMDLKTIALSLGLSETATEAEINAAIATLKNAQVDSVIQLGIDKGFITDANKETYRKLAANDLESVRGLVNGYVATVVSPVSTPAPAATQAVSLLETMRLAAQGGGQPPADGHEAWTFDDWQKKDAGGLLAMRTAKPDQYKTLAQAYHKDKTGMLYTDK